MPFFKAGREGFHIVLHNGIDLISMKTIGTMVMIGGKIWVVIITIIVGVSMLKVIAMRKLIWFISINF
jgi:hypothetical protein